VELKPKALPFRDLLFYRVKIADIGGVYIHTSALGSFVMVRIYSCLSLSCPLCMKRFMRLGVVGRRTDGWKRRLADGGIFWF
jgi:hypothetical protein